MRIKKPPTGIPGCHLAKLRKVCKLCIDIGMLVITLLLMASERTGIVLHMFLGAALFVLVVAHNILNLAWWAGIGKGTYSRTRWTRTIWNVLLLIDFIGIYGATAPIISYFRSLLQGLYNSCREASV